MKVTSPPAIPNVDQIHNDFEASRPQFRALIRKNIGPELIAKIDVEDVLNDAIIRILTKHSEGKSPAKETFPWMHGIVRDVAIETVRRVFGATRDIRRQIPLQDQPFLLDILGLVQSQTGPGTTLDRKEQLKVLWDSLLELDEVDRKIVVEHSFEGRPFAEIAEKLGMLPNTANRRYLRALLQLRKILLTKMGSSFMPVD